MGHSNLTAVRAIKESDHYEQTAQAVCVAISKDIFAIMPAYRCRR
jgi:hypothetical protein